MRSTGPIATLATATLSVTLGALPIFLVGANAIFIRNEIGFGETALGAAASLFYLGAAASSVPGGRITERLGAAWSMGIAALLTLVSVAGIAGLVHEWWSLGLFLMIGGSANGLSFPASALALAEGIPIKRQGIAFGVKQSSGPYATLLAGASVPLVALTIGWRWAFVLAALITLPVLARSNVGSMPSRAGKRPSRSVDTRSLWILSMGAFSIVVATSSFGAFYVESSVVRGITPALAGTLLAVGSALGVVTRIVWGGIADRQREWHFPMITAFLLIGAIGFSLMGRISGGTQLFFLTVLIYGTGWAWPSVLSFAVVQRQPQAPAVASGIIGTGQYGGGIIGPIGFGFLVERFSYQVAWQYAGVMALVAAGFMFVGGRGLSR